MKKLVVFNIAGRFNIPEEWIPSFDENKCIVKYILPNGDEVSVKMCLQCVSKDSINIVQDKDLDDVEYDFADFVE